MAEDFRLDGHSTEATFRLRNSHGDRIPRLTAEQPEKQAMSNASEFSLFAAEVADRWRHLLAGVTWKDALGPLVSSISAAVALSATFFTRNKEKTSIAFAFLNEWRADQFYQNVTWVRSELAGILSADPSVGLEGFRGLSDPDRRKVQTVSHFLDYVGGAMLAGVVNERLLLSAIGEPVIGLWRILEPLIRAERRLRTAERHHDDPRHGPYQLGFEHVAAKANWFLKAWHLPLPGHGPFRGLQMPNNAKTQ